MELGCLQLEQVTLGGTLVTSMGSGCRLLSLRKPRACQGSSGNDAASGRLLRTPFYSCLFLNLVACCILPVAFINDVLLASYSS